MKLKREDQLIIRLPSSYDTIIWLKWPGTFIRHFSQSSRYPMLNDLFMPGWLALVHELTVCLER